MLVVTIHDVAPPHLAAVAELRTRARAWGATAVTLLAVPDFHGAAPLAASPATLAWLRGCAATGDEIALHGLRHVQEAPVRSRLDRARAALFTAGEGELLELVFGAAWRPAGDAVRLLCIVGGLRALSFLLPPLLDGVGRADLTLRYTICAAILVPAAQLAAALGLGDALGWRAVALAWVIAYPIAFAVLVGLVLAEIDLSPRTYLRGVRDALIAGSAGLASGALIAAALPAWPAAARVAVVAAAERTIRTLAARWPALTTSAALAAR